jgi:hypothetical protein
MYVPAKPTIRIKIPIARFMFTLLAVRSPWERNPAVAGVYRTRNIRLAFSAAGRFANGRRPSVPNPLHIVSSRSSILETNH